MTAKAGAKVVVIKRPRSGRDWRKHSRTCTACEGTGMLPAAQQTTGHFLCPGCNGRGYVTEWRKRQR